MRELFTVRWATTAAVAANPSSRAAWERMRDTNPAGRIYGVTFVDRRSGIVVNGSVLGKRVQCALRTGAAPGHTAVAAVWTPPVAGELSTLASRPGDSVTVRHANLRGAAAGTAAQKEEMEKATAVNDAACRTNDYFPKRNSRHKGR